MIIERLFEEIAKRFNFQISEDQRDVYYTVDKGVWCIMSSHHTNDGFRVNAYIREDGTFLGTDFDHNDMMDPDFMNNLLTAINGRLDFIKTRGLDKISISNSD